MMRPLLASLVIAFMVIGCKEADTPETYGGKGTSEWLQLAKDNEPATRIRAVTALATMKGEKAKAAALNALSDPILEVRVETLHQVYKWAPDDKLIDAVTSIARDSKSMEFVVWDAYLETIQRLGPKAQAAAPHLNRLLREDRQRTIGDPSIESGIVSALVRGIESPSAEN